MFVKRRKKLLEKRFNLQRRMMLMFSIMVIEILLLSVLPIGIDNAEFYSLLTVIINSVLVIGFLIFGNIAKHRYIIVISYFLKIGILLISYYDLFPIMFTGADSVRFDNQAMQIWNNPELLNNKYGTQYQPFLGRLYMLVGPQKMLAQYTNVILSIIGLLCIDRIFTRFEVDEQTSKISMFVLSLSPVAIILSSVLMRDAMVTNFFIFSTYFFLLYTIDHKIKNVILSFVFISLASIFHSGVFPFVVGIVVYVLKEKSANSAMVKILCTSILFIGIYSFSDVLFTKFSGLEKSENEILEQLQDARGGSVYLTGLESNSIMVNLLFSPIKIIYFLFSPMPWDIRHLGDIIMIVLDSVLYYFMIVSIIKSRVSANGKLIGSLTLGIVLILFAFANGTHNSGTAARHRYKVLPAICIIYGLINSKIAKYGKSENFDYSSRL